MVVWVLIHNIQLKAHWHIDGHFADIMRKHTIQKALATQYTAD